MSSKHLNPRVYWLWNLILERHTQLHKGIIPPGSAAVIFLGILVPGPQPQPRERQSRSIIPQGSDEHLPVASWSQDLILGIVSNHLGMLPHHLVSTSRPFGLMFDHKQKTSKNTFQNLCKTRHFPFQNSFGKPFQNPFKSHTPKTQPRQLLYQAQKITPWECLNS